MDNAESRLEDVSTYLPRWTKRAFTDPRGRDPLGLSRVSNIITDYLLTGIITQTNRARYYSFYCWALWHIQKIEKTEDYRVFINSFRIREAFAALSTVANNGTSPVGVEAVKPKLAAGEIEGNIDCNFRVLPSNALGGYGQYYGGSLYNLGLIIRNDKGIDQITEGVAKELAEAFQNTVASTPYIKKNLYKNSIIGFTDFNKSKNKFSLETIKERGGATERKILIDLFFGFCNHPKDDRTILRQHSLGLILHTVKSLSDRSYKPYFNYVDNDLVYYPRYFSLLKIDEEIFPYVIPEQFNTCHTLWRQFCVQHFFTQALESLLFAVIEIVGAETSGRTIDHIVSIMIGSEFLEVLRGKTEADCLTPAALLNSLGIDSPPSQQFSENFQKELIPPEKNNEIDILDTELKTPAAVTANAIMLLSILYCKWRGMKDEKGLRYIALQSGKELWVASLFTHIDDWFKEDSTWETVLKYIVTQYVVNQHDRIMYEKGKLDSCWISSSEGRIYKEQDYSPRKRSTRHQQAVEILIDLCLLKKDDENRLDITPEGIKVLKRILKENQ